jgi:hypothetical protein
MRFDAPKMPARTRKSLNVPKVTVEFGDTAVSFVVSSDEVARAVGHGCQPRAGA